MSDGRIDKIEKAIEEMIESRKNDRAIIERLDRTIEKYDKTIEKHDRAIDRHDKILANLEANQIVMGKAMDSIKEDVHGIKVEVSRLVNVMSNFMDMVGMKFKEHEGRIEKLEGKEKT